MLKRFLVLEGDGDEDLSLDGTDDAAAASDGASVPGPGDPEAGDPADDDATSSDELEAPLDGDGSLDAGDGGSALDAPPEPIDPDTPIELEDTSKLEVDRLKELTDDVDRKEMETRKTEAGINTALNDLVSLESLYTSIKEANWPEKAESALMILNDVRGRYQMDGMALEDFQVGQPTEVALEGFISTIQAVFKAVIAAIVQAIDWIKLRFKEFFTENRWVADSTKRLTDEVMHLRQYNASAFRYALKNKLFDETNYVNLPLDKRWLTYDGKQPGSGMKVTNYDPGSGRALGEYLPTYAQAFEELLDLASMHELYSSAEFKATCEGLTEVARAIKDRSPYPAAVGSFQPQQSLMKRAYPLQHYHGYNAGEQTRLYVCDGYLGNVALVAEVGLVENSSEPDEAVRQLGLWKIGFHKADADMNNDHMRYLYDDEIVQTTKASLAISDELTKQRRTVDIFNDQSTKLKNLLAALEGSFTASDFATSEALEKTKQYEELCVAVNAVVRNVSSVLDGAGNYCRKIQYAWLKYLNETFKHDQQIVKTAH